MPCCPAFVLCGRLDAVETIGAVIEAVVVGAGRGAARRGRGGCAAHDGAGLGAPLRRSGRRAVGGVRGAGRRARRRGPSARSATASATPSAAIGAAFEAAAHAGGLGRAGPVAVRVGGERREADRHQHEYALSDRRQASFHASGPVIDGTRTRGMTWTTTARGGRVAPLRRDRRGDQPTPDAGGAGRGGARDRRRGPIRTPTAASAATRGERSTGGCGPGGPAGSTR